MSGLVCALVLAAAAAPLGEARAAAAGRGLAAARSAAERNLAAAGNKGTARPAAAVRNLAAARSAAAVRNPAAARSAATVRSPGISRSAAAARNTAAAHNLAAARSGAAARSAVAARSLAAARSSAAAGRHAAAGSAAAARSPAVARSAAARTPSVGRRIAREASRFVGARRGAPDRDDCSGFVELIYRRAHVPLDGSSDELRRIAARRHALRFGRAHRGDLVFFRDTIEGQRGITHVGIIDTVARDGAATFVHRAGSGVVRSRLDLHRPHTGLDARGRLHNDILRRARGGSRAKLSAELFAGFASADRLARPR